MPKFKKPPRNSYYFYMVERRKELEAEGHRFKRGMQDVALAIAGEWKLLSKEQRVPYEIMAKQHKQEEKSNLENKFTCSGESYAHLNKRLEVEQLKVVEQQSYLESLIRCDDPLSQIYVAMHAIPCCAAEVKNSMEKEIWPLEFCIAAFTLKHGVIAHYWSLIDTVRVPTGYLSEAKDTAEETLLPVPGSHKFRDVAKSAVNYGAILWTLKRFVDMFCRDYPRNFVVFGMDENLHAVKGTIKWLVNNVPENKESNQKFLDDLTFMSLPTLVLKLSVFATELNPDYVTELSQLQLIDSAVSLLSWTHFDYRKEITCPYHVQEEHCETMQICSSNFILRRIFIVLQEIGVGGFNCEMTERHDLETFQEPSHPLPPDLQSRIDVTNEPPPHFQSSTEQSVSQNKSYRMSSPERGVDENGRRRKRRYDPIDEWNFDHYYNHEDVKVNKKPRVGPNECNSYLLQASVTGHNSVLSEIAIGHSVPVPEIDIADENDEYEEEPPRRLGLEDFPVIEHGVPRGRGVRRIPMNESTPSLTDTHNRGPNGHMPTDTRRSGRGRGFRY